MRKELKIFSLGLYCELFTQMKVKVKQDQHHQICSDTTHYKVGYVEQIYLFFYFNQCCFLYAPRCLFQRPFRKEKKEEEETVMQTTFQSQVRTPWTKS